MLVGAVELALEGDTVHGDEAALDVGLDEADLVGPARKGPLQRAARLHTARFEPPRPAIHRELRAKRLDDRGRRQLVRGAQVLEGKAGRRPALTPAAVSRGV
jgi:hypothetical protein